MPSPMRLRSCCCCIDMELGLKILGFLELIGTGSGVLLCILGLAGVAFTNNDDLKEQGVTKTDLTKALVYILIEILLCIFAAVFLLFGVFRRNISFLKYSLGIRYLLIVGTVIGIILMCFDGFDSETFSSAIFYILINGYFTWVIYSYRADLVDSKVSTTAA